MAAGRDFEFANDLIREALYATTPEPARLAYHQRAADRLTSQPESLARHAAACGDWLRAARALLSAADEAFRRFAVTDSAALATQALEAAERAGDLEVGARARVIRGRAHEGAAFTGSDYHDRSIEIACQRAGDAGVAGRVSFEVAAATEFSGTGYDLAAAFDCLHDMGDPLGAARHVRQALAPDGTWLHPFPPRHGNAVQPRLRGAPVTSARAPGRRLPASYTSTECYTRLILAAIIRTAVILSLSGIRSMET